MEQMEYRDGPFAVSASRVDDKVTIRLLRDSDVLVEIETSKTGARNIASEITGVLD